MKLNEKFWLAVKKGRWIPVFEHKFLGEIKEGTTRCIVAFRRKSTSRKSRQVVQLETPIPAPEQDV
jgi:hypothetical protein